MTGLWTLFVEILPALVRYALTGAATELIHKGIITPGQFDRAVEGFVLLILILASMAWAKVKDKVKINTALALPKGSTPNDVAAAINDGKAAPALSAPNEAPRLKE